MKRVYENGYLLYEWLLTLGILITILSAITVIGLPQIQQNLSLSQDQVLTYQFLNLQKQSANASLKDQTVSIQNETTLQNEASNTRLNLRHKADINHLKKLGFKPNGNTKFSGTLTISSGKQRKRISVSAGNGQITAK